jgi:hypothetical protein
MSIVLEAEQPVRCSSGYVVVASGTFEPLSLVGCRRVTDETGVPTCAFLAGDVVRDQTENQA